MTWPGKTVEMEIRFGSLSVMVPVAEGLGFVAPLMLERTTWKFSVDSGNRSDRMVTGICLEVSPGLKVKRPDVAV